MRVLIINTSEKIGGAAIAASRLMDALKNNGVKAKMLVRDKQTDRISVAALHKSMLHKIKFVWERVVIWTANRFKKDNLFLVDIANTGTDITSLPEFKEADIIHLHWINQGYLSLKNIRKIIDSGKPVVWTMHDMWPFTGICHYSGECAKYQNKCNRCPLLLIEKEKDLSLQVFRKKEKLYSRSHITFVACSHWLGDLARGSALLSGQKVISIPNAINTNVFQPMNSKQARLSCNLPAEKKLLLFGSLKITDKRKGIDYLIEACAIIQSTYPQIAKQLGIVIVGHQSEQMKELFPFPVYVIDYVHEEKEMAHIYNAADVFVTPSLQDNLPNTIVESMACGTPCVGFGIGGIPEMINHQQNGYLAQYKDAKDLAKGIVFVLDENNNTNLATAAAKKAIATYNESNVAMKYIETYHQAIGRRNV